MSFHFRREPRTHGLLIAAMVVVAIAIGASAPGVAAWRALVEAVPPRLLFAGSLLVLHTVLFWSLALAFLYVDTTDRPAFVARHRIQSGKRRQPELARAVRVVLFNQFVLLPPLLFGSAEVLFACGWRPDPELPGLVRLSLEVLGQAALSLPYFYVAHRILHRKWWLKRVHRVHHEFRTTSALASEYAHWFEFVVGNFGALSIGALVLQPSLPAMWLFSAISIVTFVVHHSGYALPWAPWSVPHDWHHYRYHELFGSSGILDRWLGTAPEFQTFEDGEVR